MAATVCSLIVMQWNARALNPRTAELKNFLHEANPKIDVVCINETRLDKNMTFKLQGYNVIKKDRVSEHLGGGVITLVRAGINFQEIPSPDELECITIKVYLKNEQICISNVYIAPLANPSRKSIEELFHHKEKSIITGDFNGHSALWGNKDVNKMGRILDELVDENEFVVLNTGEPTYQKAEGGMPALDVNLALSNITSKCTWSMHDNPLGSDHLPTLTFITGVDAGKQQGEGNYNLKKGD